MTEVEQEHWKVIKRVEGELLSGSLSDEETDYCLARICYHLDRLKELYRKRWACTMGDFIDKCIEVMERGTIFRVEEGSLWKAGAYYLDGEEISEESARAKLQAYYTKHPEERIMDEEYISKHRV